jgi:hypothetical protein
MKSQIFSRLSQIKPENPATYAATFVTIDIDWADDTVLSDTVRIVEEADIEATWFVTHYTELISRLRENPKFELGIHPNFNFLLDGDPRNGGDVKRVIEKLLDIVPEAKSLRSHSLLTSTKLLQLMPQYGLTHESNIYMPPASCDDLRPFRIWNELVRVPHSFEDDLYLLASSNCDAAECETISKYIANEFVKKNGFKVLDFHPIHVFLNTENLDRYERTRDIHRNPDELIKHRYDGDGTRTALEKLLELR